MKSRFALVVMLVLLAVTAGACNKADPPCPPGAREVYLQEADQALAKRVKRLAEEANDLEQQGKTDESAEIGLRRAATFQCGYDKLPDGTYRKADFVYLAVADVMICLSDPRYAVIPLNVCITGMARSLFAGSIAGHNSAVDVLLQVASKVTCFEFSREVDVEPEKHGLERTGPGWVQITIFALIQAMEALGNAAVPAPALFLITPKSGGEEACVDRAAVPPKRCADTSGCPDRPEGAEDAGQNVIPPGTDPGGIPGGSTGDYP